MRNAATPITLIIIGVLGIIWYFGWLPDIDSVTSIALVAGGVAILVMDGITKSSVVLGPTLIAVGVAWWLHDQYRMRHAVTQPTRSPSSDRRQIHRWRGRR